MAGHDPNQYPQQGQPMPQQQYQDPNQPYYDPNALEGEFDEDAAYYNDEEHLVAQKLPWMAIALVGHALALFIAVFIVTSVMEKLEVPPSAVSKVIPDQPVDVTPEEKVPEEVKEKDKVDPDATEVETVEDNVENQDQSDVVSPVKSPNPNVDDSDSPSPNSGPNSNSGLGVGGGGGGGGPRGAGGGFGGRSGIRPQRQADRTNAALQWLADHQNRQGYWSPDGYHKDSIRIQQWADKGLQVTRNIDTDAQVKKEDDVGLPQFQVGLTGLALLALVGDGHTHEAGDFKATVKRAAQYLIGVQDPEGCFGKRDHDDYVYNHAICAMAFCELFAMTGSPIFKAPAQRAVDFIVKCQNPGLGWRYGIQPKENDSSVTAWMVLALKSAKIADLKFDSHTVYEGANAWYDKIEGKDEKGYLITGYNTPASGNARPGYREDWAQNGSMDACNAMVRLFTGKYKPGSREISALAGRMMEDLPAWRTKNSDGTENSYKVDYYYWYYGSLAAFQIGHNTWSAWEKALMFPILLEYQRGWHPKDRKAFDPQLIIKGAKSEGIQGRQLLDEHGSWDGLDPWCVHGGRVYATAINCLTLEVYYRYARVDEK